MSSTSSNSSLTTTKMFYKFSHQSSSETFNEIKTLTNDFDINYNITSEFVKNLETKLLDKEGKILKGFLYAPKDPVITKRVIGKNGCYFHQTTSNCDIEFIWHNRDTNQFLFWGEKFKLIKAMNIIRSRIIKYSS